jgi:hypothetical protein
MPAISADAGEWSHAVFFSSIAVMRAAAHGQWKAASAVVFWPATAGCGDYGVNRRVATLTSH